MRRNDKLTSILTFGILSVIFLSVSLFSCKSTGSLTTLSDSTRIVRDLNNIVKTKNHRFYRYPEVLDSVASYIFDEFSKNCDTVYYQTFQVDGRTYRNVIGSIGIKNSERIVVGTHYDVAYETDGADDNASGMAGVLELSRLLKSNETKYRIDFVAYTLEEPPYFKTTHMGSYVHAKDLFDKGIQLKGMICLDMIGYFSDKPNSQTYPVKILKPFYGDKGDYITVVKKFGGGGFPRTVNHLMKKAGLIETKTFTGPPSLPGVDFSDHLNYWKFDYEALMITNTAFYRNENYHKPTDTLGTLNIAKMCQVIDELYYTLKHID